jgi:hypothetical protein
MEWTQSRVDDSLVEWTREDGYATLRRRRRPDGEWIVRLDRLHQAPDGRAYRHERVTSESAAVAVIDEWKSASGDSETGTHNSDE